MKKLFLLMALTALIGLSARAVVDLPYEPGSFTEAPKVELNDEGWSYKDYGVAESSWVNATNFAHNGNNPLRLGAASFSTQASDIYLVSPKFKVKKGNEYTLKFYTKSQAALNNINFDAYFTSVSPVVDNSGISALTPSSLATALTTTYTEKTATFTATENGEYYFALRFQGLHSTPVFVATVSITEVDNGGGDEEDENNDGGEGDDDGEDDDDFVGVDLPYEPGSFTEAPKAELNDGGWSYKEYGVAASSWVNATNFAHNGNNPLRLGAASFSTQASDIYLVSPKFKVKKGNEYTLKFYTKSQAALNNINFDAYFTSVNPVDDNSGISALTPSSLATALTTTYTEKTATFTASESGEYYFALRFQGLHSTPVFVATVSITEIDNGGGDEEPELTNPEAAKNFTAVAADGEVKVTLSWENPVKDLNGNDIIVEKIELYRDGGEEPFKTFTEAATSFEDTTETGLNPGEHTYSIVVYANELASEAAEAGPVTVVAPVTAIAVPHTFTLDSADAVADFTIYNGESSTVNQHWAYNSSENGALLISQNVATEDDWLITPPLSVEKEGSYRVKVNVKLGSNTEPYDLSVWYGTSTDVAQMTQAGSLTGFSTTPSDANVIFNINVPGTYYFAVHAGGAYQTNDKSAPDYREYAQRQTVKAISILENVTLPGLASDVKVTAGANKALEATVTWTNPTETSVESVTLAPGDITRAVIYRDGEQIAEVTDAENLVPGQTGSYTDTEIPSVGEYTYKVEIYTANGKSEFPANEVTSPWIGGGADLSNGGVLYQAEDFNDWTFSATGNYRWTVYGSDAANPGIEYYFSSYNTTSVDDWAVSPYLEFEPNKVYSIRVATHQYYYYDVYEDTPYELDLHIGTSDGYKAGRLGTQALVNITPSSTKEDPNIDVVFVHTPVEDEPVAVDLTEDGTENNPFTIAPGTLRVALHASVVSPAPDCIIKSVEVNLVRSVASIEEVGASNGVNFDADGLTFDGVAAVDVYSVDGTLVASEKADGSYSLSNLGTGLFIVRVTPENGSPVTLKVVK